VRLADFSNLFQRVEGKNSFMFPGALLCVAMSLFTGQLRRCPFEKFESVQ
jgi:hypothetical protein